MGTPFGPNCTIEPMTASPDHPHDPPINAEAAAARAKAAREGAAERVGQAREAARGARDAAVEKANAVRESATDSLKAIKPRFRGVSHEWAFFLSLGAGIALLAATDSQKEFFAIGLYVISLWALFGTSALYHRINWKTPESRMLMRRLDHSMIFLMIAGTVTPFAVLTMPGTFGTAILIAVWVAATIGVIVEILWISSPKWVSAAMYVAVGWIAAVAFPEIVRTAGVWAGVLIAAGGILYTVGAVIYATGRPNPSPTYFGYHEIFHLFVIGAAALHFAAIALFAL